jgi:hypothetical protein
MVAKQLYVKVNTVDYTAWLVKSFWGSSNQDSMRAYLRDVGVDAFTYEHPSFFGRLQGWMEVPEGVCVKVNLS